MADDATLKIGIEAEDNATADMRAVADSVANLNDKLNDLVKAAQSAARAGNAIERSAAGIKTSSREAATGVKTTTSAIEEQTRAAKELQTTLNSTASAVRNMGNPHIASGGVRRMSTASVADGSRPDIGIVSKQDIESQRASNFAREHAIKLHQQQQRAIMETVRANAVENRAWIANRQALDGVIKGSTAADVAARMAARGFQEAGHSAERMNEHLFQARFAYHDISNATGIAGAALIAFNAAAVDASATYETAMAQIQRTTGASSSALDALRKDFIGLAQTIPGGFDNLAQIGELAGQLNVPEDQISSFTSTVARFVSSTDTSVQSATEAFGRLDALLPDVNRNYEALGSSILNVGVNSVATESAIISTVTQIAAAGAAAKMTAGEVIGLAASYASLGIAPEASRGSTIRIFAEIREAVATGGAALEEFGRISGVSANEFRAAFNRSGTEALGLFLTGLDELTKNGESAELALRNLGITGVRDINALLRLSQNLDIVNANLGYATDGFSEATALGDAFAITSATLNSKLEILAQSFQAFLAEMGASNLGPIKAFVDFLNGSLKVLTDMADNPAAQWIAGFAALATVVSGAALLIVSISARMAAFRASVLLAKVQLEQMAATTSIANQRLIALRAGALNAAAGLGTLRNTAMVVGKGLGWTAAIMAGFTIAMGVWESQFKSAQHIAADAGADFAGLRSAMVEDAEAFREAGRESEIFVGTLTTSKQVTASWVGEVERATGATVAQSSATSDLREQTQQLSLAMGENSKVFLATQIANSQAFQSFMQNYQELTKSGQYDKGLDTSGVITKLTEGDIEGARKLYDAWKNEMFEYLKFSGDIAARINFQNTINDMDATIKQVEGSIQGAKVATESFAQVAGATGVPTAVLTGELEELDASATNTANGMSTLSDAVTNALSGISATVQWTAAAQQLFAGLAESGATSFDILGQVGVQNMNNLIEALTTTIAAGAAMGASTTESVAALFRSLQQMGVDTAYLLSSVANIPGVNVDELNGYLDGTRKMSAQGEYLSGVLNSINTSSQTASSGIGNVGSAAKKASADMKEAIVTAADFANTISQLSDRAFQIRYGFEEAKDATQSMLNDMAQKAKEAYDSIERLNMEIGNLKGDNANLEFALSVAESYGDDERARAIRAQIAENNAEIAEKAEEAQEAQDSLSRSTEGNSDAAIENRKTLRDLAKSYQDQVEAYAATGKSQKEVEAYARRLYKRYKDEAAQLGYNKTDTEKYGKAISDTARIIAGLPKDAITTINIKGLDAADAALKEFNTKAKEAADRASNDVRTGGGRGYGIKIPTPKLPKIPPVNVPLKFQPGDVTAAARDYARRLTKGLDAYLKSKRIRMLSSGGTLRFNKDGTMVEGNLGDIRFFKSGGYTGDGSKHAISGMTHGKEYVINEENTSRLGTDFFDAINAGKTPVVPMGNSLPGVMVVELSAYDRKLLAANGNVKLSVNGKILGEVTSAANFGAAVRGSN